MENKFNFKTKRIKKDNTTKSQRQLRVGEELRHLISNALHRETFYDAVLESNNITVTEVNVSPDLKNAKVFIMPLGGENKIEVLESLNKIKGYIQKLISSEIQLRQIPRLSFVIDTTFEYANKIDNIIKNIKKND
ncbi:30S ribosome-binding factor RbfA [Alphaproteobacteria bacterium]|nr:30S ribosome-binding factor RbfA [Alphaproteobacteria bacterium]